MATLSEDLRVDLLDHLFGGAARAVTIPATWTVALYRGDQDPFTGGDELTGVNYAAVTYANSSDRWSPATEGISNNFAVRWPATGNAGTGGWVLPGSVEPWVVLRHGSGSPMVVLPSFIREMVGWTLPAGQFFTLPAGNIRIAFPEYPTLINAQSLALSIAEGDLILGDLFGGVAWTAPGAWEIALWKGSPFGGGVEVTDAAYSRETWTNDSTAFAPVSGGVKTTLLDLRWPSSGVPVRVWGQVTHVCFCRPGAGPSAALRLAYPITPGPGMPLALPAGSLNLSWYS